MHSFAMKRIQSLTLLVLLAATVLRAETSPWTGSFAAEGEFYFYNIGTGLWLQNNDNKALNQWSTRAEAGSRGLNISVSQTDGGWLLNPGFGGNHSINGGDNAGYLDTMSPVTVWQLNARHVQGVSNAYTLSSGTTMLGVDDDGFLTFDGTGSVAWQLVTREERIASLLKATTDTPLDASWLIQNPDFALNDERYTAWSISSSEGNTVRVNGTQERPFISCQESWNSLFLNFSQTIELIPSGIYRLSVQGFYRDGSASSIGSTRNAGNETIRSVYYANEVSAPLMSICESGVTEGIPAMANYNSSGWWIPDHTDGYSALQNAAYCFANGLYQNPEIEVLVTNGTITIGIRKDEHVYDDWTVFDSFALSYCGADIVDVEEITLSETNISLSTFESFLVSATITPQDATYKGIIWSTSDSSVASVKDGVVSAIGEGSATITARASQRTDIIAQCSVLVRRNELSPQALVVNEIMPANIDTYLDPSWNYGAFVEIYNPTEAPANLARCYLSDDPLQPLKWHMPTTIGSVPAKGFKTIWFDHYDAKYGPCQANFKLNSDGGVLCISDDRGQLVVSCEYPAAISRCAWARTTDGGNAWEWTSTPTPGSTNNGSTFAHNQLEAPVVSRQSGSFSNQATFKVTIPDGCSLRYTTDGSIPTPNYGTENFTGSFRATETTVYRFRLFKEGMLPSPVVTRTFYKKEHDFTLPVLSVVANHSDLYGSEHGIFATGPNGRAGNGRDDKCNWNMDWDRPANVELIDTEGNMVVNQEVDIAVCGGWSRAWNPRSFKLKAQKQYEGKNYINYTVFDEKPYIRNKTIQVRNGGNDNGCRIKDAALQQIVARSGLDIDYQSYQPVHHFINGKYIGVINMREPNNKHFVLANYGYDTDEIDQFEISPDSNYIQMTGTKESFDRWYELSQNAADEETYAELCQMVDIDEFINYIAVEFYLGNWDWPKNNLKGYRPRTDNGRFRLVLFDLDGAFSVGNPFTTFESKRIFTFDVLRGDYSGQRTEEIQIVTIFLNMLQNDSFRKQFIDSYCLVTGSVFEPNRCAEIVNEMANRVAKDMSYKNESPWSTANDLINRLNSNYQQTNIRYLKGYSRMKLTNTPSIQASLMSDIDEARLLVNGLPVPTGEFNGQLFPPVTITALSPAGYRFKGWKSTASSTTKVLLSKGSIWKYYDQGSLDGVDWKSTAYNDQSWTSGQAPLGYFTTDKNNQRGYKTFLDYGGNTSSKRITYYFRTSLFLDEAPSSTDAIELNYTCDDGFAIYINGTKAGSYLMPSNFSYNTVASSYAPGNPDSGTLTLSSSLFRKGNNVIAVEVHNNSASSTDIYWDGEITLRTLSSSYVSTVPEYSLPSTGNIGLMACYEKEPTLDESPDGKLPVRINEVSPANDIYVNEHWKRTDWIELYNATDNDIDVTGMYLSNEPANPLKFQITNVDGVSNIIPAHGFSVVWCDKLEPVRTIHTDFKLAADGGYVMLTTEDEQHTDTLHYSACDSKHSVGLYPDGGDDTYLMNRVTIGASNQLTTADTIHMQEREPGLGVIPMPQEKVLAEHIIYDLFGRRVYNPIPGTIYIIDGKKTLFRLK